MIPVEKYSICSALNVEAPSLLFQQVGSLLYYFNGWGPSLLFQRVGPLLHYFNGLVFIIISTGAWPWGPFFIISTGGAFLLFQRVHKAPSLLFQRVGLFYYFNGCVGPLYYFNGWAFFIISTGGAPSSLFHGWGPFFIISGDALGPAHLFSPFVFYW